MTGIRIENLSKTYRGGRVRALDRVSLEVRPGEAFGIIGPNGAGKTTLVGCLLGLLRPDSGTITLDGRPPDDLAVKRVTGYLPERLVLDRWMTGRDFMRYHHALAGLDPARRDADCDAAISGIGLAAEAGGQTIRRYSRGMLQRLGLAQALLGSPRFVFLDEPISGVDPAGVVLFRRLLQDAKARGATLVINSHQLDEIERLCDRVAFVRGGQVQSIETPQAGAEISRVVVVRWAASTPAEAVAPARLGAAAGAAGARFEDASPSSARFSVADDDGAARLFARLVESGVRVTEASPEGGRLERLFTGEAADAGGAAAAGSPAPPPTAPPAPPRPPDQDPGAPYAGPYTGGAA
jgi:ABC-2 type transport system ATP-binding protein